MPLPMVQIRLNWNITSNSAPSTVTNILSNPAPLQVNVVAILNVQSYSDINFLACMFIFMAVWQFVLRVSFLSEEIQRT
jgi:hypothetical protein